MPCGWLDETNEDYAKFEEYYNQRSIETGLPSWLVLLLDVICVADIGLNQDKSPKEVTIAMTVQGAQLLRSPRPDPTSLYMLGVVTLGALSLAAIHLVANYYRTQYAETGVGVLNPPGGINLPLNNEALET